MSNVKLYARLGSGTRRLIGITIIFSPISVLSLDKQRHDKTSPRHGDYSIDANEYYFMLSASLFADINIPIARVKITSEFTAKGRVQALTGLF